MKVIGLGAGGCVLKPPVDCINIKNSNSKKKSKSIKNSNSKKKSKSIKNSNSKKKSKKNEVSKITDDDNEFYISKKIINFGKKKKINVKNYFCLIKDKCFPNFSDLSKTIKKKCGFKKSSYLNRNRNRNKIISLTMDDCGLTIEDYIQKNSISTQQFEKYIIHLLKGLDILHKNKILHGDIKELNILINNNKPKYIDFGGSISIKNISLSEFPYEIISTRTYRPPEIVFIFHIVSSQLNYLTYLNHFNYYEFINLLDIDAGLDTTINKNIYYEREKTISYYSNISSNYSFEIFLREFKKNILKFDIYSLGKAFEYLIMNFKIKVNQKIIILIENMTKLDFTERFSCKECLKFMK